MKSVMDYATLVLILILLTVSCNRNETEKDFDPRSVSGPFRWDLASGEMIRLSLSKHPFTESHLTSLSEFSDLTGIKVDYSILSEEEYRDKFIIERSSNHCLRPVALS